MDYANQPPAASHPELGGTVQNLTALASGQAIHDAQAQALHQSGLVDLRALTDGRTALTVSAKGAAALQGATVPQPAAVASPTPAAPAPLTKDEPAGEPGPATALIVAHQRDYRNQHGCWPRLVWVSFDLITGFSDECPSAADELIQAGVCFFNGSWLAVSNMPGLSLASVHPPASMPINVIPWPTPPHELKAA